MRKRFSAIGLGFLVVALLSLGLPGASAQSQDLCPPAVCSENVHLLTTFPDTLTISMEFAHTGDLMFVSSLDSVSSFDISDPKNPVLLDTIVNATFENESMTYGEQMVGGTLRRFVIVGVDLINATPESPEHIHIGFDHFMLVDVTDPADIKLGAQLDTTTSTHTVQCVDQGNCDFAYTAGGGGKFEVLDLRDPDNPKVDKEVASPAAAPYPPTFGSGSGHYWDFDNANVGWHTGSGGAAAFDVSDPQNPLVIQATNPKGQQTPYNDFIHHNSARPNADRFEPNTAPDVENGNVLLVTEEDYANEGNEILCEQQNGDEAGTFQTWEIPNLNGAKYRDGNPDNKANLGDIRPLDIVNAPSEFGDNAPLSTPVGTFCSGHWFDYRDGGLVAQGYYQQGLWLEDVSDASNIKYYGHYTPVATEVWDAYWVPKRDADGVVTGEDTNIIYTADAVRGIDVLEVDLNAPAEDVGEDKPEDDDDRNGGNVGNGNDERKRDKDGGGGGVGDTGDDRSLPATGGGLGLLLLGAAALPAAAYIGRRRR